MLDIWKEIVALAKIEVLRMTLHAEWIQRLFGLQTKFFIASQVRASAGASRWAALVSFGHLRRLRRAQCDLRRRQLCYHLSLNQR